MTIDEVRKLRPGDWVVHTPSQGFEQPLGQVHHVEWEWREDTRVGWCKIWCYWPPYLSPFYAWQKKSDWGLLWSSPESIIAKVGE